MMGWTLIIIAFTALVVTIAFLLFRLNQVEKSSQALQSTKTTAIPADPTDAVFAQHDGQALWNLLASPQASPALDADVLEDARQRYAFVLLKHASAVYAAGARGIGDQASNTKRVVTLRGAIQSWMPESEATALFECGQQSTLATDTASIEAIRQRLHGVSRSLAPAIQAGVLLQLADRLLPQPLE